MQAIEIKTRNIVILFFSLFLILAVFSQVSAKPNPKPTSDVGLNKVDWLYYKSSNDLTAYLGKKSSHLPTVRYQKGNDYLEFSMTGVSSTTTVSLETNTRTPNTPILFYRNILAGVDANYQITNMPFKIKEEIILKSKISNLSADRQDLKSKNLSFLFSAGTSAKPSKQKDGSIAFFGENGEYLFQLDKPFMIDAKGSRSEEATIEIISNKTNQNRHPMSVLGQAFGGNNQFFKQFKKFFPVWDLKNWNLFRNFSNVSQNRHPMSVLGKQYQIILKADEGWLSTAAYPVIIDPTVTHNADANFTGQMNRIADSDTTSSTQLESSYPEATKDPHTVLLLHFNEANGTTAGIKDYASTTRVITANGNASTTSSVTQLGLGNSAAFDGTTDYFSVPDSDDWAFGSGDFTIDFWARFSVKGSFHYIITQRVSGTDQWQIYKDETDKLTISFINLGDAIKGSYTMTSAWPLSANTWYHIAWVRNGTSALLFIDGIRQNLTENTPFSTNSLDNKAAPLWVGSKVDQVGGDMNGSFDEVRITKGRALTPEEIKAAASRRPYAVYTSPVVDAAASVAWNTINWTEGGVNTGNGEQPYSTGSLVAQWDFNDTSGTTLTASSSGSCTTACNGALTNFAYTASQDQATTTTGWTANNKKWGAGALMMESAASADYVSITDPASNALDPGTGDFSVEGWIKSSAGGQDTILQNNTTVGACATNAGYILIVNGNRNLAAYASDGATCYVNNLTANASSTEIADGRWHHFAFVADRDTKAYVYYDGRLATSTTINNTTAANPAATIYFGASGATGDSDFILDSSRFYSRALSAAEVLSNYQAGNIEIQTRVGATSDPNDGSWEAWKPTTGETQLLSMDSDAVNWHSDIMASTTVATSTETVIKAEGTGSLKIRTGMASTTAGAVALWHFEETGTTTGTYLYDETANNNDATTTGTTVVDGIFGKARSFNGTSDYVSVADSSNFDIGLSNEPFTIEAFVKTTDTDGNIISRGGGVSAWNSTNGQQYHLTSYGGSVRLYWWTGATWADVVSNEAITTGRWTYVVVTYNGTITRIFINGVAQTDTETAVYAKPSLSNLTKMGLVVSNEAPINGDIDEVRILKGRALSADEIAETYRMGANHHLTRQVSAIDLSGTNKLAFNVASDRPGTYLETMLGESDYANYELASSTLALSTNTVLYIKGDEIASSTSLKDSSFSGKAITANGNARTAGGGKIGNAVYFDGTGDYLSLAASSDWNFGTGDWAIDLWHKSSSDNSFSSFISIGSTDREITIDRNVGKIKIYVKSDDSTWIANSESIGTVSNSNWQHLALVRNVNTVTGYVDGVAGGSWDVTGKSFNISAQPVYVGLWRDGINYIFIGNMDEVRIIKGTALTADQIRQAYEYGLRTHPITIDFGATLQSSDLISSATDYNFSLTATTSGLSATTSGLYLGDKIIIKENLGGTEYTAQGTVNAINTTTGAITVPSWDTGSTFPSGNGYSPNATVFKWQREYFDLTGAATTTRNAITNLTLRPTNGAEGRTIYLDDFRYNTNYLTASSSSSITSGNNRYLQYRAIFSSADTFVSPFLTAFNTLYTALANSFPSLIGVSGGGFLSF